MDPIALYLQSISPNPELYDAWQELNERLFDGALKPIPVIVGLSRHGKHAGFCAPDHIALQPSTFAGAWKGVLAHEMCHQADHQAGIEYKALGRVQNIHNSTQWCDRINGVMRQLRDKRFAVPYRRNRAGAMVPMADAIPEGLELIPYEGLKAWEPMGMLRWGNTERFTTPSSFSD